MTRSYEDAPGGHRSKYWTSDASHAWFTRMCRRTARAKAKQAMRRLTEPAPKYPIEKAYYD